MSVSEQSANLLAVAKAGSISVVIPAYNEAENLGIVVNASLAVLAQLVGTYEIVIIDDMSTDETGMIADQYAARQSQVRVIHNTKNVGCHPSELIGFMASRSDLLFFIPSDRQIMPDQLSVCLAAMANADYVCTNRVQRADPVHRRLVSGLYNFGIRVLFRVPVHDVDSSVLIRRAVVECIGQDIDAQSAFISVELIIRALSAGFRVVEVPIVHHPRVAGKARGLNMKDVMKVPANLARFWLYLLRLRSSMRKTESRKKG